MIRYPCGHFYRQFLQGKKKSDTPAKTILTVECLLKAVEHKSLGTGREFERNWSRDSQSAFTYLSMKTWHSSQVLAFFSNQLVVYFRY